MYEQIRAKLPLKRFSILLQKKGFWDALKYIFTKKEGIILFKKRKQCISTNTKCATEQ